MPPTESHFIDGAWSRPASDERIPVYSASTEEPLGAVPRGTPADVDRAVAAARAAFDRGWAATSAEERAAWLERLAGALEARIADLAHTIAGEVGSPISMATSIQARSPVAIATAFARVARAFAWTSEAGPSLVVREPYGVVGAITPWNYPLHQIMAKVAGALAAGCTVVLKPSELAPLNAQYLAEACLEIGLPPGVVNIVHGNGPEVGEAIASHDGVDLVSFTGSVRAGRRVASLAGAHLAKVTLELGGKSASVLLDDAPIEKAVTHGVKQALLNSGQTCSAWTRMVVPRGRLDDVLEVAARAMASLPVGDPFDQATRLGPLISEPQRARVEGYIAKGQAEGARLVYGGGRPSGPTRGHYVEPALFAEVAPAMTIAQEEIFGPVIAVLAYENEDEAVAIANGTVYGLAGAVWSADGERALAVARRMRTGQVDVNGARYNPEAPFGGYKQSGIGREFGAFGLEEFLQVKAIQR